ncbi:hypothetical protein HYX02_01635 [Candidatus Woesearchaeota archaeon]|nr:hypothetical protein [Candidatus Woesearchaeota archaeon]
MKYAHLIKLTAFSYEREDNQSILDALFGFFPFNLEENKVILKKTEAAGFNEKKIMIFEITTTKEVLINQFLKNLSNNLGEEQKNKILQQIGSRLDKNLDFFLRFDKDAWINDKKLILTDSGKCFHIKISVAAFPKKREIALKLLKNSFSEK